jgi:hypothetical protein
VNNYGSFSGFGIVQFTLDVDGSVHDIFMAKSMACLMDDLYQHVIRKSPNWLPASINRVVKQSIKRQPFHFSISTN